MAVSQYGNTYYGLSTDTKPSGTALNGREFREMDTGKKYLFDEENGEWLEQPEEGGGGGGGSSTLSGLTDVDISNPTDGQTLVYNAESGKWENGAGKGSIIVTDNYNAQTEVHTLDKTWQEIKDAIASGAEVLVKVHAVESDELDYIESWGLYAVGVVVENRSLAEGDVIYSVYTTNDSYETDTPNGYPSYRDSN